MLSTTQLAAKLGVTPGRVRQWHDAGRIKPILTLPNGHYLWRPTTPRPKPLPPGPKPR